MTTFVILAAGYGSRIGRAGDHLHKALIPLGGRAVLSHLLALAPPDADMVVCTGYREEQIRHYLAAAHPAQQVRTVFVDDWDVPGVGGPGLSLLAAEPYVNGDLVFTSCDTLWSPGSVDWNTSGSWLGLAPIPTGTPPERWCRVLPDGRIADKVSEPAGGWVHTGMGRIAQESLRDFWEGLRAGHTVRGELQMSAGFGAVHPMGVQHIDWMDVGDAEAYRRAVELHDGYDWSKTSEATYLLPENRRAVKFHSDLEVSQRYQIRATDLAGLVPDIQYEAPQWTAITHVEELGLPDMAEVLRWADVRLWEPRAARDPERVASRFYEQKTLGRVDGLRSHLAAEVSKVLPRVPWDRLAQGVRPTRIHGDLTFGNLFVSREGIVTFDWRPDFGGSVRWGDQRYDLAKLWSGCRVDWRGARHGDFRPPADGPANERLLADYCTDHGLTDVPLLAALCLLNSAPLHPAPLDEILVTRGAAMLEEFL